MQAPHAGGFAEGHVGVRPLLRQHALLPVAAAELVADDGVAVVAHLDVDALQVGVLGAHQGYLVHHRHLLTLQVTSLGPPCTPTALI